MKKILLICVTLFFTLQSFAQWQVTAGPHGSGYTSSLAVQDTFIYAGTETGGIAVSIDHGNTWTVSNTGLTNLNNANSLVVNDSTIFVGFYNSLSGTAIFNSTNHGASWSPTSVSFMFLLSLAVKPGLLIGGTWDGVTVSTNNGSTWNSFISGLPSNASVSGLAFSGTKIFGGVTSSSVGGTGVFASVNNGSSWTPFNTGLGTNTVINKLIVVGSEVFAGTPGGVYKSGTTTSNWSAVNNGLGNTNIRSFHSIGSDLFAGTSSGIFYTTNGGINWNDISTGLPSNTNIYSITSDNLYLYVGTDSVVWRRPLTQVTGIREGNPQQQSFNIYPNPVSNYFTLTMDHGQFSMNNWTLTLSDVVGKKILSRSIIVEEQAFDISSVPPGVYFVTITNDQNRSMTKKLLKME
jgi:hypothetical protein